MFTADEMGLGKTLQLISLVLAKKNEKKEQAIANGEPDVDSDPEDSGPDYDDPKKRRENRESKTLVFFF